jgi:hypothetical protein
LPDACADGKRKRESAQALEHADDEEQRRFDAQLREGLVVQPLPPDRAAPRNRRGKEVMSTSGGPFQAALAATLARTAISDPMTNTHSVMTVLHRGSIGAV